MPSQTMIGAGVSQNVVTSFPFCKVYITYVACNVILTDRKN